MTKPLPLSHSSLEKFRNCPAAFHEIKVLKSVPDTKGDAAKWGDYVHLGFEKYLKGEAELPNDLEMYREILDAVLAQQGDLHVEIEMAINSRLEPCAFDAPDVFVRGYADWLRVRGDRGWAGDWKTGKQKSDSRQMMLMALLTFYCFPEVQRVRTGFFWLKVGKRDIDNFTRAEIPAMWNVFLPDIQQYKEAFEKDVWQPRQSGLCNGWCNVTHCEYWKPKRLGKR